MDGHLDGRLRHAGSRRRFSYTQPIELDELDGLSGFGRKLRHEPLQIEPALDGGGVVVRRHLVRLIDCYICHRCPRSAQKVDEPVACDRINPRREGLRSIIGVTTRVERDQCLLNEILRIGWTLPDLREVGFEIGAQIGAQPCQKRFVCRCVTIEPRHHQAAQLRLVRPHAHLFSVLAWRFREDAVGSATIDVAARAPTARAAVVTYGPRVLATCPILSETCSCSPSCGCSCRSSPSFASCGRGSFAPSCSSSQRGHPSSLGSWGARTEAGPPERTAPSRR